METKVVTRAIRKTLVGLAIVIGALVVIVAGGLLMGMVALWACGGYP